MRELSRERSTILQLYDATAYDTVCDTQRVRPRRVRPAGQVCPYPCYILNPHVGLVSAHVGSKEAILLFVPRHGCCYEQRSITMDKRTLLCRSLHVAGAIVRTRLRSIGTAIVLTIVLFTGTFSPFASAGFGIQPSVANAAALNATGGKPNHFDPTSGTKSVTHLPPAANLPAFTPEHARPPMVHGFTPSMKQGLLVLDPAKDTQFRGSDGRLEVDVPAGAVTTSDVAAAGGTLAVRLTEIAPASESNAGGSGVISLGSYLLEVVDGQGNRFAHGLRKAATLLLHYGNKTSALDLDQAFVVFNGAHPTSITGLGAYSTQTATHDRTHHILQAQLPIDGALAASPTATAGSTRLAARVLSLAILPATLLAAQSTPSTTFTFNSYAPVAK